MVDGYGNIQELYLDGFKEAYKILPVYHNSEHENRTLNIAKFKFVSDSYETEITNQQTCSYINVQNDAFSIRYDSDLFSGHQDTITQDDNVRKQYLSLPYPAVPKYDLVKEKMYYEQRTNNEPFSTTFAYTLEGLNHFLFEGKNQFR